MELAIYIKNLLYNHDKVTIRGFGTLQTVYKAAEINSSQRTVIPPSKKLIFDGNSTESDGLLEKYIANQNNTTKKGAEKLVSEQVQKILDKLNEGETILFEGIGYISKDNEMIRFECEQDANFLTDSFGLSKVEYKPVEFRLSTKHNAPTEVPKKRKTYTFAIMFIALFLVIGGGIGVYLYYPDIINIVKKFGQKAQANTNKIETPHDTLKDSKDTTKQSQLAQVVDSSTTKKTALSLNNVKQAPSVPEKVSFYIIAGSFKTFERANILAKQLKKEGYKPEVIQFEQEIFRVSLGEFKDKPQALKELDKIKATKGDGSVWLLTKRI